MAMHTCHIYLVNITNLSKLLLFNTHNPISRSTRLSGHVRWARKRWLNKPARCSRKSHFESAGHKAESSPP